MPIALCLLVTTATTDATAVTAAPIASVSSARLHSATAARNDAVRTLGARQRALHACLRTHAQRKCASQRSAVRSAETAASHANQRLSKLAAASRHQSSALSAPRIVLEGQTLSWNSVPGVEDYVFVRKVPGRADEYSTLTATTTTPPAVPGTTVRYSVRTDVAGSAWAHEVSIAYPSAPVASEPGEPIAQPAPGGGSSPTPSEPTPGEPAPGESTGAAPEPEPSSPGTGSNPSEGPSPGSGATGESGTPPPVEEPASGGVGSGAFGEPFVKGIDTNIQGWGSAGVPAIAEEMGSLGVDWAREDLEWSKVEPQRGVFDWSSFDLLVEEVEARGISVLPIVGYAPSWTSPTNAAAYAEFVKAAVERYGPGTTADLRWWELWNEPYAPYAWSGHTPEPEAYARDVVAAAQAARSAAPSVKLLVAADYQDSPQTGGSTPWQTSWIDDMFAAEPTLGQWIDGVSVHPYGADPALPVAQSNGWKDAAGEWSFQRIDDVRAKFLAHGVDVPFWITEVGWSTWEVSEATQAHDYSDLIEQVRTRPWVRALFPYCLREFEPDPTNNQSGFGLLKFGSWQPKAAFFSLQAGLKELH